jgi:hypothetical protein
MEFTITVRSTDPSVAYEISQMKIEGVTIRERDSKQIREIYPEPIYFIVSFASAVLAQLIANYLYDKLKDKKEKVMEFSIDNQSVQINAEKIEQVIINLVKEKEKGND